ncbi:MAG: DNA polymerase IV [Gammaproteobacteria bacterium]
MDSVRKIIHIDMDAFFAAVEQRDHPHLRNKPLIVGGRPDSRGVVATCSYEARKYGIHSAMPSAHAYRLCPHALFVKPRFEAYREASATIRKIFFEFTDRVEPLSLDEAYLDVSESRHLDGSATLIAKEIKRKIRQKTELTASAGVSYNKFLAKIASDLDKPDGLHVILPEHGASFVETLPIGKFHGIGKATEKKMQGLGIFTGKDLKNVSLPLLQRYFGKAGLHYYNICRGIDERPVDNHRISKSIGVEVTFQHDIDDRNTVLTHLSNLLQQALAKTAAKKRSAHTLTVKIKYHDFVQITRSRTVSEPIIAGSNAESLLNELLKDTEAGARTIRLLGITLSSLTDPKSPHYWKQIDLFEHSQ